MRADLMKRTGLGRQETRIAHAPHTFLVNLQGAVRRGEDFVDGCRQPFSARRPGSLIYIPAGNEWSGWDEGDATASYLAVSIEQDFADQTFQAMATSRLTKPAPLIGFRDSIMEVALQRIALELKHPDPISATMVECQATQLFVQLARLQGSHPEPVKGGLSPFDLKRVVDMIEALPDQNPSLAELAREVQLSRFHFCRAFRQSTGVTPHEFIARLRLKRSSELLRATNLSATEIAMECGFGSSSHFAIAFKRAFGASPTEFRRMCRT